MYLVLAGSEALTAGSGEVSPPSEMRFRRRRPVGQSAGSLLEVPGFCDLDDVYQVVISG